MIDDLLVEKEDEMKHKDYCIESINTNDQNQALTIRKIGDLQAKAGDLEAKIAKLNNQIKHTEEEVAEMKRQLKKAGEDRDEENTEYQKTVTDQRATQTLISKALEILQEVYGKSFIQQNKAAQPAGPPPPPGFKKYEKQG